MIDRNPPLGPFDYGEQLERDRLEEDRYWAHMDRLDRHSPAPDCIWTCPKHGTHRCITGCPKCKDTEWERAA